MKKSTIFSAIAISISLVNISYIVKKVWFNTPTTALFKAGQCVKLSDLDPWETEIFLVSSVGKHSYLVRECDSYGCNREKSIVLSASPKYEDIECPDYSQ